MTIYIITRVPYEGDVIIIGTVTNIDNLIELLYIIRERECTLNNPLPEGFKNVICIQKIEDNYILDIPLNSLMFNDIYGRIDETIHIFCSYPTYLNDYIEFLISNRSDEAYYTPENHSLDDDKENIIVN